MPRGASAKREREYKELKQDFKKEGRYKGREEEVAARIVNKQRAQTGETKEEKKREREGKSPDRNLPVKDYDGLTVAQVGSKLGAMSKGDIRKIKNYETKHRNRKTLIQKLDRVLEEK